MQHLHRLRVEHRFEVGVGKLPREGLSGGQRFLGAAPACRVDPDLAALGSREQRAIEQPWLLLWYQLAMDREKATARTFRLDRVQAARVRPDLQVRHIRGGRVHS